MPDEVLEVTEEIVQDAVVETPVETTEEVKDAEPMLFMGQEIALESLDIPDDLRSGMSQHGLDVDVIARELYTGEFGLSEETKSKLDAVYGKYVVDAALKGIENSNKMAEFSAKESEAATVKAAEAAWSETLEIVGTEENWDSMNAWAEKTLSEAEMDSVNAIMEGGDWFTQKLVIQALWEKSGLKPAGAPVVEAEKTIDLVDLGSGAASGEDGPLTFEEYKDIIGSGEYTRMTQAERNLTDNRRRAGIIKGI